MTNSYWLQETPLSGERNTPADNSIVVIGSGFSGVSCVYFLQQAGCQDILLLDDNCQKSASFRNCGHILPGPVESMYALQQLHGTEKANMIWQFSQDCCARLKQTVETLDVDIDYHQDGYLVIAIDEIENDEIKKSIALLHDAGFAANNYVPAAQLQKLGICNARGARFDAHGAAAHPLKFRNAVLAHCLTKGLKYHSGQKVSAVAEHGEQVVITLPNNKQLHADAVVLATNAYTALLSQFFAARQLITPFRGQIITSAPLTHKPRLNVPFSFNHGYEYGLITPDNRLMLGGWRENTAGEKHTFDLTPNPTVEAGLQDFAAQYLYFCHDITWQFSWSGIMGASTSGLPYVSPTPSSRIFVCAGFTGHGFGWAHGCAELLQKIMTGDRNLPPITPELNCYR